MKYTIISFSFKEKLGIFQKILYTLCIVSVFCIVCKTFFLNVLEKGEIKKYIVQGIKNSYAKNEKYPMKIAKNNVILSQKKKVEGKNKVSKTVEINREKKITPSIVESATKSQEDEQIIAVMRNSRNEEMNYKETNYDNYQKVSIRGVTILNYSSNKTIDYSSLFKREIILNKDTDKILLYNTHTSETFANSENYKFGYTGTYRTTDARYNMLNIAQKLKDNLEKKNIKVVHDTTPHDYGSYNNAYKMSRKTLESHLQKDSNYGICIDVHRDAAGDLTKGYTVDVNGKPAAQLSIVIGMGTSKNPNKYAVDNLSLAMQIVEVANKKYPGLLKKIIIKNSKYNQDFKRYSLLIECGFTGNKIEEVEYSTELLSNVLNCFYK